MSIRTKTSWGYIGSIIMLLTSLWPSSSYACPGLLLGQHLPFNDRNLVNRNRLALYVKSGRSWQPIPMQVDPLDSEGSLQFPKNPEWKSDALTRNDRLSFNIDRFAERYDGKNADILPCGPREMIELSYQGKYAYLMTCEPDPIAGKGRPVTYEEAKRTVISDDYSYRYTESNHLVFEQIQVASRDGKGMIPVAKDSDLLIVGDVKKFFTLYFDSSDIDAEIVHKRQGPLGLMGGMEFFLRILAFKIDMQLLPEVNFFEDSLFMPMSMTLPVNAAKYLRRGSGIYYSWAPEKDVEWQWDQSELDDLNLELLNPNGTGP